MKNKPNSSSSVPARVSTTDQNKQLFPFFIRVWLEMFQTQFRKAGPDEGEQRQQNCSPIFFCPFK